MINWQYLKYFSVLAKIEHVTRAAEELCISQPSLSNAIHALESEYGVQLIEKTGRNIVLTKFGRELAGYLERGFRELEEGDRVMRRISDPTKGHIDVGFFHSQGIYHIPALVHGFRAIPGNEDFSFSYGSGSDAVIQDGLKTGKYDVAFCSIYQPDEDLEYIRVASQPMHVIVSKKHRLADRKSISLKELNGEVFISYSQPCGLQTTIAKIISDEKIQVNYAFSAEQGSTIAGMVAADFGVSILPDIPLPPLPLCRLEAEEGLPPRIIYMVLNRKRYRNMSLERFMAFVQENSESLFQNGQNIQIPGVKN